MTTPIRERSELLFLFDTTDANPNGDPMDDNRPRQDQDTGENLVSDTRFKRTIRDYLIDYKDQEVFVRELRNDKSEKKELVTKEARQAMLGGTPEALLEKCVDLRLFGATIAVKGSSLTVTGPVQFKNGRSLHPVHIVDVKGTSVMPSKEGNAQGTFTEMHIVPYSLIAFYGIINENAAALHKQAWIKGREIWLTEEDVDLLLEGMWHGTRNLISRSKFGQMPRLLLRVVYKEPNYHIGELNRLLKLNTDLADQRAIRSVQDFTVAVDELAAQLRANRERVGRIEWAWDTRLRLTLQGSELTQISELVDGIRYEEIAL